MNNRYRVEVNQNSLQYQCQDQADLHHNLKQKISKKKVRLAEIIMRIFLRSTFYILKKVK